MAPVGATNCAYCGARLAYTACPACFASVWVGHRHCGGCGTPAEREPVTERGPRRCPHCRTPLVRSRVGEVELHECARGDGLWLDGKTLQRLTLEREQQSAVLGMPNPSPSTAPVAGASIEATTAPAPLPAGYIPCPECGELMNRVNFARVSGVLVDLCNAHGTWFDRDELRRIVEFIVAGGVSRAREFVRERLREAERRVRNQQRELALQRRRDGRIGTGVSAPLSEPAAEPAAGAGDLLIRWLLS